MRPAIRASQVVQNSPFEKTIEKLIQTIEGLMKEIQFLRIENEDKQRENAILWGRIADFQRGITTNAQ